MNNWIAILSALTYLCLLFGVAYYAEYRLKKGKSIIITPMYTRFLWVCTVLPGPTTAVLGRLQTVA